MSLFEIAIFAEVQKLKRLGYSNKDISIITGWPIDKIESCQNTVRGLVEDEKRK